MPRTWTHVYQAVSHGRESQRLGTRFDVVEDVRVVRNPTDFAFWERAQPVRATEPVVLMVGRIDSRRAPEVLVRAVATLKDTVRLHVILRSATASLSVDGRTGTWTTVAETRAQGGLAERLDLRIIARSSVSSTQGTR
jgi:glycosyltransferase involved in cell wall biosynthesis